MANIKDHLSKIITSVFGKDVRKSLHDGLSLVNEEVETTTNKQIVLEKTFEQLIINEGNSNAEIVAARVDGNLGVTHKTIGDRLDSFGEKLDAKVNANEPELKTKNKEVVKAINEIYQSNSNIALEGDSIKDFVVGLKFKVTDSQSIPGVDNENIKVSPKMGIKII